MAFLMSAFVTETAVSSLAGTLSPEPLVAVVCGVVVDCRAGVVDAGGAAVVRAGLASLDAPAASVGNAAELS
jgi:hypothetical protein